MDINEIVRQAVEQVLAQMNAQNCAAPAQSDLSPAGMAKYIDHTLLKADAPISKIKQICDLLQSSLQVRALRLAVLSDSLWEQ